MALLPAQWRELRHGERAGAGRARRPRGAGRRQAGRRVRARGDRPGDARSVPRRTAARRHGDGPAAGCLLPPASRCGGTHWIGMAFLALDNLTKSFGSHLAVDRLTLEVEKGEFVSLLGPSGCGKTTTLQMIAGFVEPTGGAIRLEGRDLLAVKPAKRGLGIVCQSYALFPHMTVTENVSFGLEMQGVAAAERTKRVGETLELVGLGAFTARFPRQLSGGQQQRVALARALVIRPQILLLDEPLSNLDAKLREEMQIELRQIQRTVGTTTILVTHDQAEAMALSDRIVVMNHGRAEQIGPPHEAYERPATPFVASFLGRTNLVNGTTVRPEKIWFATSGLAGKVRTRIFQGNHWLYQVETAGGLVTVIRQNTGEAMPGEGEAVHLAWAAT